MEQSVIKHFVLRGIRGNVPVDFPDLTAMEEACLGLYALGATFRGCGKYCAGGDLSTGCDALVRGDFATRASILIATDSGSLTSMPERREGIGYSLTYKGEDYAIRLLDTKEMQEYLHRCTPKA
jgi:hypothetical protein